MTHDGTYQQRLTALQMPRQRVTVHSRLSKRAAHTPRLHHRRRCTNSGSTGSDGAPPLPGVDSDCGVVIVDVDCGDDAAAAAMTMGDGDVTSTPCVAVEARVGDRSTRVRSCGMKDGPAWGCVVDAGSGDVSVGGTPATPCRAASVAAPPGDGDRECSDRDGRFQWLSPPSPPPLLPPPTALWTPPEPPAVRNAANAAAAGNACTAPLMGDRDRSWSPGCGVCRLLTPPHCPTAPPYPPCMGDTMDGVAADDSDAY